MSFLVANMVKVAILAEYKRVLAYDKLDIEQNTQMRAIIEVTRLGVLTEPVASEMPMLDKDDRAFHDALHLQ